MFYGSYLVLFLISFYFILPVVNYNRISIYLIILVINLVFGIAYFIYQRSVKEKKLVSNLFINVAGGSIVIIFVLFVAGLPIFRASGYKNLLPSPKYKEFSKEINYIDEKNIPTVNEKYAKLLADKKLGEETSLGSRVELGDLTLQNVNGKLYYVGPLNHSGLFKWMFNKSTPGYIMVSATNDHDVKLVKELNGKSISLKYSPSAYLNDDLKRHIYLNGEIFRGITDFTFEIDDKGKPYWTATIYKNTIGFSGKKSVGIVLVDAETGNIKKYSTENAPKWVDRIQPLDFVESNVNKWGKYIHGAFNFSGKDKLKTTEGVGVVYNNGRCYYYTGLTSVGKDESTVGFTLVDTRTQEATIFKISGATETAGTKSSEGKVQNLGYTGSFPVLINVENIPTYFVTLNDKNGLTKMFAMVSVSDYNAVGTGESISECKSNYIRVLQSKGNTTNLVSTGNLNEIKGTILRINSSIINGSSFYTFVLKEHPKEIFQAPLSISNELPITQINDKITIKYNDTKQKQSFINCLDFDNLEFAQE
ncbi:cell shape-determining protein [Haloimpatiens sp. FM7315]|uniref:cell shape-determining protein n=1 Tax=Haloimpatiens sp. FM7315 TaxID=3298609 RepID=UPI00370B8602